jgi:hypothetical protein
MKLRGREIIFDLSSFFLKWWVGHEGVWEGENDDIGVIFKD